MMITFTFYLFAAIAVFGGVMVISSKNPVHSVLYLILTFFTSAGLFVLMGAEFLAMILVIVYVGAVAVLFLFVVMMLDVDFARMKDGFLQYLPIGGTIGIVLLAEIIMVLISRSSSITTEAISHVAQPTPTGVTNTEALGLILYTDYIYIFQAAGLILLVAMIGAIVLTHRKRPGVKRQNIAEQVARNPKNVIEVKKVRPGKGI